MEGEKETQQQPKKINKKINAGNNFVNKKVKPHRSLFTFQGYGLPRCQEKKTRSLAASRKNCL